MVRTRKFVAAILYLCWLLPAISLSQQQPDMHAMDEFSASPSRISEMADRAWESREAVRSQLFEAIPEAPPPEDWELEAMPVERFKRGFFQRASFAGGWVGTGDRSDLGISTWESSMSFAVPLGSFENLLIVTPSFRADYLDGPLTPDVPGQLYETGATFLWRKQIRERWSLMTLAAPMVRSDFESTEHAIRVFGLGLATWEWVPDELKVSFGAVYLDREDVGILPALGLQWTPEPWWQIDVMFPRPRVAYRLAKDGPRSEMWGYLGGALGGNTWSVRRADGSDDELSLRDFRLMLGIEQIRTGGGGWFAEMGYVFGRRLEYSVEMLELEFADAWMARAGVAF